MALAMATMSCGGETEHEAEAVADTAAFMRSKGINSLISDSGVLRYKLIAEEWDIYTNTTPSTWKFMKGLLMQRFDRSFQIDLYVLADTAYLHQQRTWELRGRVLVKNTDGTIFKTDELFWDMADHVMWNNEYMHVITPERELEGTNFRSNEAMTDYLVTNSVGRFPVSDAEGDANEEEETPETADTLAPDELYTPGGERTQRVMPTAPGKHEQQQQGHFK